MISLTNDGPINWRSATKFVLGTVFGAALATVVAVKAQQALTTPTATYGCAISDAATSNLNTRITMVGATAPDPSKYFTVGGVSSCIGPMTSLDLSKLIPDPMGLLTSLAKAAVAAVVQKACTAARQSMSDYLGKYNAAVNMTGGGSQQYLSTAIGSAVGLQMTNYGTSYAAPAGSSLVVDPLAAVTGAANSTVGSTASTVTQSATQTVTSTATSITQPVSSAIGSGVSAATGVVSSAKSAATSLSTSVFGN